MSKTTIGSYLGIGVESTYGTAVAASKYFEFLEESLKFGGGKMTKPSLARPSAMRTINRKKSVDGSVKIPVSYGGGFELLLKHLLGASVASAQLGATNAYSHVYSLATTIPTGLTLRAGRGEADHEYIYAGCKIPKSVFSIVPEGELELTMDILGSDETLTTLGTPTFTSDPFVQWNALSASTISGNTINIQSMELTIENALDTDTYKLGSLTRQQPNRNAHRKISGKVEFEFVDLTQYNHYKNGDELAIVLAFNGGVADSGEDYLLQFNIPNAIVIGDTPNVSAVGALKQVLNFEALAQSVNSDMEVTLQNLATSVA